MSPLFIVHMAHSGKCRFCDPISQEHQRAKSTQKENSLCVGVKYLIFWILTVATPMLANDSLPRCDWLLSPFPCHWDLPGPTSELQLSFALLKLFINNQVITMVSSSPRIKNLGMILNYCSLWIWGKCFLKKDNGPGLETAKQGLMEMEQEFRQAVNTHQHILYLAGGSNLAPK